MEPYERILLWDENDLKQLPITEDDHYEYKGGKIKIGDLEKHITTAASAFWNTGGGILCIGIDNKTANIDGGLPLNIVGRDLYEWVDQLLDRVKPRWSYARRLIRRENDDSLIAEGNGVLILSFPPSPVAPHMASDNKYYIRANGRKAPADHYLVEAIRARQLVQKPVFSALLRFSSVKQNVVEMVILVLNEATALNIEISFAPVPPILQKEYGNNFKFTVPVINKMYPFAFEIALFPNFIQTIGEKEIDVNLTFRDEMGRAYKETIRIPETPSIGPIQFDIKPNREVVKAIDAATKQLENISRLLKAKAKSE